MPTEICPPELSQVATSTPSSEAVAQANRKVYNRLQVAHYNQNRSILNPAQTARLSGILTELREKTGGVSFLDVGTGTGQLLTLAREIFPICTGVDQADRLLAQVRELTGFDRLVSGRADALPFASESFDAVGMYALLHHLYDPSPALAEAFRVLKPGGMLYTDHDPNYFFGRFYHLWYRFKFRNRHGFGDPDEDLAEYHHSHTSGLNPEVLRQKLVELGFDDVRVHYRHPTNHDLQGARRFAKLLNEWGSKVIPAKSLYTRFMLFAKKR